VPENEIAQKEPAVWNSPSYIPMIHVTSLRENNIAPSNLNVSSFIGSSDCENESSINISSFQN
jgi:hypothetical protein